MLTLLLAADAPDAGGWNVTTTLAAVAAGISLVTLVVTTYYASRRETVRWAREALAEAYYDFVNASYAADQAVHEHQKLLWGRPSDHPNLEASAQEVEAQEMALRHAETKIRLLAPSRTVDLADKARLTYKNGAKEARAETTEDEHNALRRSIRAARQEFIESAKKDMSLPR